MFWQLIAVIDNNKQLQMLRQIYIDKYNKIVSAFKPEIFNTLTILETRPYSQTVERYVAVDEQNQPYQLYYTQKTLEMVLNQIPFIQHSPKVLVFPNQKENIIIEEIIDQNLYQTLVANELNSQYGSLNEDREVLARQILKGLRNSLLNYIENNIDYNAINPKNIIRKNTIQYQLSLVGLLLKTQKQSDDYYKAGTGAKFQAAYALGTLLFKLLFGFVPFQKKKELIKFSFKDYPKYLDKDEENKKYLKVYSFAEGLLQISPLAKQIIEEALSGTMTLESFYNHRYFEEGALINAKKDINPVTKQVKMLTIFDQSHQSLIMAAIQHRKKYPHQRLNAKLIYAHEFSKEETIEHFKKHPILCQIQFDVNFKEEKVKGNPKELENILPIPDIPYFYRQEEFDSELDLPCYDLIKLIDGEMKARDMGDEKSQQFQQKIKLYAFPYAVVFQLFKLTKLQPLQIQNKIVKLSDELLQVSQLNYSKQIQPLHNTHLIIKSFDQIKIRYRQHINELYKYFLSEAIKKYNVKKELVSYNERAHSKKMGLEYYKLCLKLMECSVLNRKKGRELDLQRIQTSTRKQVQADLNQLLKQYFPNKIEHF